MLTAHATIQLDTQHPEGMRKIKALEERKPDARGPEPEKVSCYLEIFIYTGGQ